MASLTIKLNGNQLVIEDVPALGMYDVVVDGRDVVPGQQVRLHARMVDASFALVSTDIDLTDGSFLTGLRLNAPTFDKAEDALMVGSAVAALGIALIEIIEMNGDWTDAV